MTRDETKKLIAIIVSIYPNFKPDNLSATVDAWSVLLKDETLLEMENMLKVFAKTDTSGFAPTVGQLLRCADNEPSAEEEWAKVRIAICNGYYHAGEEFDKLSPRTQAAIGSPSMLSLWAQTDEGTVDSSIAKQFKNAYNSISDRERRGFVAPAIAEKMQELLERKGE